MAQQRAFHPGFDDAQPGLTGALLAGAALQLLPLALTTRPSTLGYSDGPHRKAGLLVRLACRVAALLRPTSRLWL